MLVVGTFIYFHQRKCPHSKSKIHVRALFQRRRQVFVVMRQKRSTSEDSGRDEDTGEKGGNIIFRDSSGVDAADNDRLVLIHERILEYNFVHQIRFITTASSIPFAKASVSVCFTFNVQSSFHNNYRHTLLQSTKRGGSVRACIREY
jgi:hypothetical protein